MPDTPSWFWWGTFDKEKKFATKLAKKLIKK